MEEHFARAYSPAFGKISGAVDPCASPQGTQIAFTGTLWEKLEGRAESRICIVDIESGELKRLTGGTGEERLPRWSPDGRYLAFLSDRAERGSHQLYLLDTEAIGEATAAPVVDGTLEYFWWSPDGSRLLLAVAGRGVDLAGGEGSSTTAARRQDLLSWMPTVEGGVSDDAWRSLLVFDLNTEELQRVSPEGINTWEAAWCGDSSIAAIVSDGPGEEAWYDAPLELLDVQTGKRRVLFNSDRQLGWVAASPSGAKVAVVEALCSDRWIVAGDVVVIDVVSGDMSKPDTRSVDVTQLVWRDEDHLFFMGVRGLETVAGEIDVSEGQAVESWVSAETCGPLYPEASLLPNGDIALVHESCTRYPEIAVGRDGVARPIRSFNNEGGSYLRGVAGSLEEVTWRAPDGVEIQGLLHKPVSKGPWPLILHVHGGPVWGFRNKWQVLHPWVPWVVSRGYAVLQANPRGSSGRGQAYAEAVRGDMGGVDADDLLCGIDALVERGLADSSRVGVTGASYGGYMACWLVTQTNRFSAAVASAPTTNWYSQHFTSNIPQFDRIFLDEDPYKPDGRYFQRSPVMFASQVRTPVLLTAGAKDRCTPPAQVIEFHRALREHGIESEAAIYPEEGHGVRGFPAMIDFCTRMTAWFERYMPALRD